jgi:hypothetical protein
VGLQALMSGTHEAGGWTNEAEPVRPGQAFGNYRDHFLAIGAPEGTVVVRRGRVGANWGTGDEPALRAAGLAALLPGAVGHRRLDQGRWYPGHDWHQQEQARRQAATLHQQIADQHGLFATVRPHDLGTLHGRMLHEALTAPTPEDRLVAQHVLADALEEAGLGGQAQLLRVAQPLGHNLAGILAGDEPRPRRRRRPWQYDRARNAPGPRPEDEKIG